VPLEPITLSILGATLGALGLRSRRHPCGATKAVLALAESYLKGQTEVAHERERRLTIVATVTVLPLGCWLTETRADGTTLTVSAGIPPPDTHSTTVGCPHENLLRSRDGRRS
jgi:hypothetical protein